MIKNEFYKVFLSPTFAMLLAFTSIFYLLGFSMSLSSNKELDYSLVQSLYNAGILNSLNGTGRLFLTGFNVLIPLICMFSYAVTVNSEKKAYSRYVQVRSSRAHYLASKMVVSFLTTFAILVFLSLLNVTVLTLVFQDNPNNDIYLVMSFLSNNPTDMQLMIIKNFFLFSILFLFVTSFFIALLSCFAVLLIYYMPFIQAFVLFFGIPLVINVFISLTNLNRFNLFFFDVNLFMMNNIGILLIKYLVIIALYTATLLIVNFYRRSKYEGRL